MGTRIFEYRITDSGRTLQDFLKEQGFSRHILRSMKPYPDAIQRNGARIYMREELHAGDRLRIALREETGSDGILPRPVSFSIIYEDEDILVVDKPPDTPVHPSIGNYENTLANGVEYYFRQKGESIVFRCINRLDRDTSGLLIIAKNALSAALLSEQMQKREIQRTYIALAEGITDKEGVINLPIARKEGSVIERCADPVHGEPAVTKFKRIACFHNVQGKNKETETDKWTEWPQGMTDSGHYKSDCVQGLEKRAVADDISDVCSLLEICLKTGRTHQIRVHMAAIGHPLLGDTLYGDGAGMKRQALHSARLRFMHPITGEKMDFSAKLPGDFPEFVRCRQSTLAQEYRDEKRTGSAEGKLSVDDELFDSLDIEIGMMFDNEKTKN